MFKLTLLNSSRGDKHCDIIILYQCLSVACEPQADKMIAADILNYVPDSFKVNFVTRIK